MATTTFLAMTAAETENCPDLPPAIAWMACHFSPYGVGLSNLPKSLPPGSLLILNDRTPIHRHQREVIAQQLLECMEKQKCAGLLLDFQYPGCEETAGLAEYLSETLPSPVAVSASYAKNLTCPVFLSPLPHHTTLEEHIAPWQGREIWLEAALDGEVITLTESGAAISPLPPGDGFDGGHEDKSLHCHYRTEVMDEKVCFTLWRTKEDLDALLAEAAGLGINIAVGLYQELH